MEGSVSTACKPDGEKTKEENKGGSGGNDKLSKIPSFLEGISPTRRKTMVSDWKGLAKEATYRHIFLKF